MTCKICRKKKEDNLQKKISTLQELRGLLKVASNEDLIGSIGRYIRNADLDVGTTSGIVRKIAQLAVCTKELFHISQNLG